MLRAQLRPDERVVQAAVRRERGQGQQGPVPRKLHLLHRPALHGPVHPGGHPQYVRDHRQRQEPRQGPLHRGAGGQLRRPELPGRPEHERGQPQGDGGHHPGPHRRRRAPDADRRGRPVGLQRGLPDLLLLACLRLQRLPAGRQPLQPAGRRELQEEYVRAAGQAGL